MKWIKDLAVIFFIVFSLVSFVGVGIYAQDKIGSKLNSTYSIELGAKMWLGATELDETPTTITFKSSLGIKTRIVNPQNLIIRLEEGHVENPVNGDQ